MTIWQRILISFPSIGYSYDIVTLISTGIVNSMNNNRIGIFTYYSISTDNPAGVALRKLRKPHNRRGECQKEP